ncbi:MAG: SWIM zinc finger family protein [Caulobacteraceae bacterium]
MARAKNKAVPKSQLRFERAALRERAGEKVFARGVAYADEGRVRILSIGRGGIAARVVGSEPYSVTLTGSGRKFGGGCSCPAFEDWGFCKHLVALALTMNETEAVADFEQNETRLRAYLTRQTAEQLSERIMTLAARDEDLWRQLDSEAAFAVGDDETVVALLDDAIDQAMDTGGGFNWRGAGDWADGVRQVVGQIEKLLAGGRHVVALRALDRLFELAEEACEEIDDSEGEAATVLGEAQELHLAACVAAKPDPVLLAQTLFEREVESFTDLWPGAWATYAKPLGKRGKAEYRRLAEAAWRESGDRGDRSAAMRILDAIAQDAGDIDARIALRAPDATEARDFTNLAQLCIEAGRKDAALAWAEEGVWRLEDRPDRHLTTLAASLMRGAGRSAEAEALLWKAFERDPDMRLYQELKRTSADPSSVGERCARQIERRIVPTSGRIWLPLPDLLVEVLLEEGLADQAWRARHAHGCGERLLETLARATEDSHPDEAVQAYANMVERNIASANNGGYGAACRLVGHLEDLRARQGQSAAHAAHLQELRSRHKAKRNFIRLLDDRRAWPKF